MGARQVGVPVTSSQRASNRAAPLPNPGSYRVQRGDTLYSISWRYGLDYREVARWNNVNERFQIYPGQLLSLSRSGGTPVTTTTSPTTTVQSTPASPTQPTSSSQSTTPTRQATTPSTSSTTPTAAVAGQPVWRWPAEGQIIRRFSAIEGGSKGIDIAGKAGDSVVAAADGRVVYAGSGLLGYGNLVIINHNRQFLSAYAHNSRILVSENDMVESGTKIAEMGQTGADRVQLHFEIRRDGKPVDPLAYLPKR